MKNYERRATTYFICVLLFLALFGICYGAIIKSQENSKAYHETTTETTTKQEITETTTIVNSSNEVKTTKAVPTPTGERSQPTNENSNYLGSFSCTAYCSCYQCCGVANRPLDENGNEIVIGASGQVLTPGYSIATDPYVIPYGTIVVIDGKEYIAQDCGGAVRGNCIDFYFASHEEALQFGRQQKEVYLK